MRFSFAPFASAALVLFASGCVLITSLDGLHGSPSPLATDGGNDASDAAITDAGADVDQGPKPVGDYLFALHWSTDGRATSTAPLPGGGFVVATRYKGVISVGPYMTPNAPNGSGLLVTLDAKGGITGIAALGDSSIGVDVVTATATAVYVSGASGVAFNLNGTSVPAGTYIAKLSRTDLKAAPLWVHSMTNTNRLCGECLRPTNGGVIALVQGFGSFVVDPQHTYASHGDADLALAKLDDTTGATVWAQRFGSTTNDGAGAIEVDGAGAIHAAFLIGGAVTPNEGLGAAPPAPIGVVSTLVVGTFDAQGKWVDGRAFGDKAGGYVNPVCLDVDAKGRVLVGGSFNGGVDFGKGVTGANGGDGFVFVQDDKGVTQWQATFGDNGIDGVGGCSFDAWGHVAAAGGYSGAPTIGGTKLPAVVSPGLFVIKMSQTGTTDWVHGFPGRDTDGGTNAISAGANHVTTGADGTVVLSGSLLMGGGVDVGGGVLYGYTEPDAFVAGFRP